MKTVRFSQVVAKAGKPEAHLLWTTPEKDTEFTKALKAGRAMTVHQEHGQADYGTIGYGKGAQGQFLIFPKSLKAFEGKRVVGVKYDLLEEKKIPKSEQAKPVKPPKPKKSKPQKPHKEPSDERQTTEKPHDDTHQASPSKGIQISADVKKQVQKAMRFLKAGKQVQAYEVLGTLMHQT